MLYCAGSRQDADGAERALEELCRIYWPPVYAFLRRGGHSPGDAQDLTQSFFAHLLQNQGYTSADPAKGKFRSFLLAALKNFLADHHAKAQTLKRGGGREFLPLTEELMQAESAAFVDASAAALPPDQRDELFDEHWAAALVQSALESLKAQAGEEGKAEIFAALYPLLGGWSATPTPHQAEVAARLGLPINTLRTHLHRLRARYRAALRAEVAQTVASPDEVEGELRHLFAVLVRG